LTAALAISIAITGCATRPPDSVAMLGQGAEYKNDYWWRASDDVKCPPEWVEWRKVSREAVDQACGPNKLGCRTTGYGCVIVSRYSKLEAKDIFRANESHYAHEMHHAVEGLVHPSHVS
ncbi:MAG TPA: hypothetical protein VF348_06320, partial [Usitatibacter sp.]